MALEVGDRGIVEEAIPGHMGVHRIDKTTEGIVGDELRVRVASDLVIIKFILSKFFLEICVFLKYINSNNVEYHNLNPQV